MSWLSKQIKSVGKVAKKAGKAIGKGWEAIDDYALPAVGFALGGPGGAALGAAAARGIGDGKFDPKATLMAGAKGYGMGALGSAAGLTGGQGLKTLGSSALKAVSNPMTTGGNLIKSQLGMSTAPAGAGGGTPSLLNANISADGVTQAAGGAVSRAAQMAGGGSGGSGWDMLKNAGKFALDNKDMLLGGLAGYEGYKSDKQADALRKKQLMLAEQNWQGTAPLRTMGQSMMLDQQREDLSGIARNRANPFA
mgnify:FL=1